jgi:signal transduction histidine kinase
VATGTTPPAGVKTGLGHFDASQRRLTILVAVVGLIGSIAIASWSWSLERAEARQALDARTEVVVGSMDQSLSEATLRLASIAGFYQASQAVNELQFRRFVKKLGLLPGLNAMGYMPLVLDRNLAVYEALMKVGAPEFMVFEVSETGERVPAGDRRIHIPLQWHEPMEAFNGVDGYDSASDPKRLAALEMARVTRSLAVSPFLRLVSEEEADGFVMYWPVTDSETDALIGYATAAMDLSELIDGSLPESFTSLIDWEVTDITATAGGEVPGGAGISLLDVGGRTWQVVVTPEPGSGMTPNPRTSLLLLATGLFATVFVTWTLENRRRHRAARHDFEQLRELTQAKDQFLASVGHELRTPLTSVLGFAELLRADHPDLSEEERMSMIASVADEATDLAAIVDDLLVAARSELDLLVVTEVPVSARAQVAQVLEASGGDAIDVIEVLGEPGNPYRALGDPSRVRQILRNLITNACRYGGGTIEVRLTTDDKWVHVAVADNGAGVPEDDVDHIFDPYYRAHSNESQPAALGIGLSVARQLSRLMNGDLTYRRENDWTVFELELPVAREMAEAGNGHHTRTGAARVSIS